ncbi:PQQ-dependent sugar dehydrogenase [Nostoc ellipsosporum NOK]|nr:PQQ-dependent sugar dehydrogenase [Nostoc ellipsosporum NOK]
MQQPWEILWGPDNHIWFTERGGRISRFNPATGQNTPLFNVPDVATQGEGGLMGMVLHPSFSSQPYVYIVYNYNNGGQYREKIVRYTYGNNTLQSPLNLIENIPAANIHNGSRLLIVGDKLFASTGDANNTSLPQNISSPAGKILRLNLDGTIPSDNPVAGNPYWSLGHRNPQGLVYARNMLYSTEHGPSSDDEVNIIEKGRNYGWPDVNGFCDSPAEQTFCNAQQAVQPLQAWTPTIAPSGLDYYTHDAIPQWKNSLLFTTLKNTRLYQLELSADGRSVTNVNEFYNNAWGRLRDICISPAGEVYLCTGNGSNDRIVQISKK